MQALSCWRWTPCASARTAHVICGTKSSTCNLASNFYLTTVMLMYSEYKDRRRPRCTFLRLLLSKHDRTSLVSQFSTKDLLVGMQIALGASDACILWTYIHLQAATDGKQRLHATAPSLSAHPARSHICADVCVCARRDRWQIAWATFCALLQAGTWQAAAHHEDVASSCTFRGSSAAATASLSSISLLPR